MTTLTLFCLSGSFFSLGDKGGRQTKREGEMREKRLCKATRKKWILTYYGSSCPVLCFGRNGTLPPPSDRTLSPSVYLANPPFLSSFRPLVVVTMPLHPSSFSSFSLHKSTKRKGTVVYFHPPSSSISASVLSYPFFVFFDLSLSLLCLLLFLLFSPAYKYRNSGSYITLSCPLSAPSLGEYATEAEQKF